MASYHGGGHSRRAPNVSQYLANLNTVSPGHAHDLPADINLGDPDLDFLTNAEFFDFDSFTPAPVHNLRSPHDGGRNVRGVAAVNGAHYQFGEFQTYPPTVGSSPDSTAHLHGHYPPQPSHHLPFGDPNVGDKRKASVSTNMPSPQDMEEGSRVAAEEDKRRRNTAASARFRVKKKQREQALEKQTKEFQDKVSLLEGKVQQLEMENKWLKGLITDKNEGKSIQVEKDFGERSIDEHTTGVGTAADEESEGKDDTA